MAKDTVNEVNVMTSHFNDVLGVRPAAGEQTKIDIDTIVDAFKNYSGDDLNEQVQHLLERIVYEVNSVDLNTIKTLYKFADSDEERDEAVASAAELGKQFAFFTHLLTQMRDLVVKQDTNADRDPRNFSPQFKEALQLIQKKAQEYDAQIEAFQKLVASHPRS